VPIGPIGPGSHFGSLGPFEPGSHLGLDPIWRMGPTCARTRSRSFGSNFDEYHKVMKTVHGVPSCQKNWVKKLYVHIQTERERDRERQRERQRERERKTKRGTLKTLIVGSATTMTSHTYACDPLYATHVHVG
jgi:hypothetical protein